MLVSRFCTKVYGDEYFGPSNQLDTCLIDIGIVLTLIPIDLGVRSTYEHTHMVKINSSYVRTYKVPTKFFSIVSRAMVVEGVEVSQCLLPHRYVQLSLLIILLEGNLPKPGNPHCEPTNQQPTTTEELKYSSDRARQHRRPTNNLMEVWQNLAPFGGRPFGGAIEGC
jgi:hypothetical protein